MASQPGGLHSCVDLSSNPHYGWLFKFGFAVQDFFTAPRNQDSFLILGWPTRPKVASYDLIITHVMTDTLLTPNMSIIFPKS